MNSLLILLSFIGLLSVIYLAISRLILLSKARSSDEKIELKDSPLVSIHLAICREPSALVIKTIEAVIASRYKNFELIIISNNTDDDSLWRPIEEMARSLKRVKFYHVGNIQGFKAGALNVALKHTNLDAKYIFTLDADYILHNSALEKAVAYSQKYDFDILQYPQAYSFADEAVGLKTNYQHYFECYQLASNNIAHALPTGTLTLINIRVFEKGYKWPTQTITEDAQLGVECIENGFTIGYNHMVIGQGLMPVSYNDYIKQYKRWVFGNFQSLMCLLKTDLNLYDKWVLSILLSAWMNLLGIPLFILLIMSFYDTGDDKTQTVIITLNLFAVLVHLTAQFLVLRNKSTTCRFSSIKVMLVHISTIHIGAYYWMTYLFIKNKPFRRTNKFLSNSDGFNKRLPLKLILVGIILLVLLRNLASISFLLITVAVIACSYLYVKLEFINYRKSLKI